MPVALVTGITGQDGSYLTELLLSKGYVVHGLVRRSSSFNTGRIEHIYRDAHEPGTRLFLHFGDMSDFSSLSNLMAKIEPDEVYHLAAQSHVRVSFDQPEYTSDVVATGTLRLLAAAREFSSRTGKRVRVYNAGSSEMFGAANPPQSEVTPFHPRSPYACAKVAAHWYAINYRESYDLFVSNGILFNHESPRRGETFVTRKVTRAVGRILAGAQSKVYLGNLDAKRDWGFAGDYVDAMWRMLQADAPGDYVVATGEAFSVQQLCEEAFGYAGLDWKEHVEIDPRYFRPAEVDYLLGDASKARRELGWEPKVSFPQLVRMMVDADRERAFAERAASGTD